MAAGLILAFQYHNIDKDLEELLYEPQINELRQNTLATFNYLVTNLKTAKNRA